MTLYSRLKSILQLGLLLLPGYIFAQSESKDLFKRCESIGVKESDKECKKPSFADLNLLKENVSAIDRYLEHQQKVPSLNSLDRFQKDLEAKEKIVLELSRTHKLHLQQAIATLKKNMLLSSEAEMLNNLNKKIREINFACKIAENNRKKIIEKIDPYNIRGSAVVVQGTKASNNPNGIQAKIKKELKETLEFFDREVTPDVDRRLNSLFSDEQFNVYLASPSFISETQLSSQRSPLSSQKISQKCLEQGSLMKEVSLPVSKTAQAEVLNKLNQALEDEKQIEKNLIALTFMKNKNNELNTLLKKYLQYAPLSIGRYFQGPRDEQEMRVLCESMSVLSNDQAYRKNVRSVLQATGIGLSVISLSLTFGVSSVMIPLTLAANASLNIMAPTKEITYQAGQQKNSEWSHLRGGTLSTEFLNQKAASQSSITNEALFAIISLTQDALDIRHFRVESSRLMEPAQLVTQEQRVALSLPPSKIPQEVVKSTGLSPTLLSYSPLKPLYDRPRSIVEETLKKDNIKSMTRMGKGSGINSSYVLELEGGKKAVFKPHTEVWSSNYRAEVLAYELDRKLGFNLVPETVEREIMVAGKKMKGSVQLFREGVPMYDAAGKIKYYESSKQKTLDYLIQNKDRHLNNFLVSPEGKYISIDNGLSFSGYGNNAMDTFMGHTEIKEFLKSPDGKVILKNLQKGQTDPVFHKELGNYLSEPEVKLFYKRMDILIKMETKNMSREEFIKLSMEVYHPF